MSETQARDGREPTYRNSIDRDRRVEHLEGGYRERMDGPTFTMTAIPILMIVIIALWWGRKRGSTSSPTDSDSTAARHEDRDG